MKELRAYQKQAIKECWEALIKNDEPVLLMASVGSGKSLMLADILLKMQHVGKRALCIVNNAQLVRNNCETYKEQGGIASIYCAALKDKDSTASIIFGTPQSILNGINKNETIAQIQFNLIVVDEAHSINYLNHRSCFMRILRHYKGNYPGMRILGATGTNFRYKGFSIVGTECLFKTQVGNITTEYLIENDYLVNPEFKIDERLIIDFSKVKLKQNGLFSEKELENVIDKSHRITKAICEQIIYIMVEKGRQGIFIFATNKNHAKEILSYLPEHESALILGETREDERTRIINESRKGKIKYLVNISIVSVGIDIPTFDTVAYLRPTESLVLLVQTMGRALRLSNETGKRNALVLDFSGNIERHKNWDNPILLKALMETIDKDKEYPIQCPKCMTMNTMDGRRCIGLINKVRCDYYFEFKSCPNEKCGVQNDIAARICRLCKTELINPDDKLSLNWIKEELKEYKVVQTSYGLSDTRNGFRINLLYKCLDEKGHHVTFYEYYSPINDLAKRVFYGQFIKKHCFESSKWYKLIGVRSKMEQMLKQASWPHTIFIKHEGKGYKIKRKLFDYDNKEINSCSKME